MARVLAIGDIHGCVHALDAVLKAANVGADDTLIALGDVIDYGRETSAVIERLLELRSQCRLICIRGNHEEMLLASLSNPRVKLQWINVGGLETINSYVFCGDIDAIPHEHLEFIRGFVDSHETSTHFFTHASYDPDLPFDRQPTHILRWQLLEAPYPRPHYSGKPVVVGHTEQRSGEILDLGHLICLDTACRAYGWLTLWDSATGETWQASKWGALREPEHPEDYEQLQRARELLAIGDANS